MSLGVFHTGQGPNISLRNPATRHESCLAAGKFYSYALVSTSTLTATEYSETQLFSIFNDQIGGKDIVYDLAGKTQSVPVKITATLEGGFVHVWEKVP